MNVTNCRPLNWAFMRSMNHIEANTSLWRTSCNP
jgi:hypothetical protein